MHKYLRRLAMIFFIPFTLISMLILVVTSVTTIYYDLYQEADLPRFGHQNFAVLIIGALLFFLLAGFLIFHKKTVSEKESHNDNSGRIYVNSVSTFPKFSGLFVTALVLEAMLCLIIIISVRATAVTDGLTLDQIINEFNRADYSSLSKGGYMFVYPFQIGYVAIGQLVSTIAGDSNYFAYQFINLISVLASVIFLQKTTAELFESERVCKVFSLLSLLLFPLYAYVTYVYNDIWSVAPGIIAIYFEICYLKRHKIIDEILAAAFLMLACLLKTNLYIALIAMVILLIVDVVEEGLEISENAVGKLHEHENASVGASVNTVKDADGYPLLIKRLLANLLFAVVLFLAATVPMKLLGNVYASKAGLDSYPKGVPNTTYFAMAMQEGEGEWGWYNGFNRNTYADCDYDWDRTDAVAREAIADRLSEFGDRKLHACKFYVRKLLSQWTDPTFVSMRNMELSFRHSDSTSAIAQSLVFGGLSTVFQMIMDIGHFLVFFGVVVYCILALRNKSLTLPQALPILFVFGGMLFHELWEGSSRYILRYYLELTPFAAWGITALLDGRRELWN